MIPKSLRFLFVIAFTCGCISAKAQTAQTPRADSVANSYLTKKARTVFFELFGPGGIYSANYDTRFSNRQDGLGGRVGISYYSSSGDNLFTIPVAINYLLGKKGKYFEIGAGVTYYNVNSNIAFFDSRTEYDASTGNFYDSRSHDSGVLGTLNFGYRYQPLDGGFSFRAGVSPIISSDGFAPYWPYVSFGYAF